MGEDKSIPLFHEIGGRGITQFHPTWEVEAPLFHRLGGEGDTPMGRDTLFHKTWR